MRGSGVVAGVAPWAAGRLAALLAVLAPSRCAACGGPLSGPLGPACGGCRARLAEEAEGAGVGRAGASLAGPDPGSGPVVVAPWVHDGVARDFVHALKYGRRREVAPLLAAALLARPSVGAALAQADVVVPVPADPLRRRRRGFDQAVLLAEELVRLAATDGPRPLALRALRRRPGGPPQASLSGAARRRALPGVMRPARGARRRLAGARVVLVDDVVTTGATFQEATRQLAALGARVVAVVACTRAGAPGRATRAPIRGEAP